MLLGAPGAVVRSMQGLLRLTLTGPVISVCLRCVTLRGFRRDNINGPGTLGNGVPSVAAAILRIAITNMKFAAVSGDRIALGELECERPIVHCDSWRGCAVEICEAGSCDRCQSLGVACGRRSENISWAIAKIKRLRGMGGTIELVNQGSESRNHEGAVAARTRPRRVECCLRK